MGSKRLPESPKRKTGDDRQEVKQKALQSYNKFLTPQNKMRKKLPVAVAPDD